MILVFWISSDHFLDYFVNQNHRNIEFQMMYIPDGRDTPSVPLLSNFQGDWARHAKSRVIPVLSIGPEQVREDELEATVVARLRRCSHKSLRYL